MPIPDELRRTVLQRARGRCECAMLLCEHHRPEERCVQPLAEATWRVFSWTERPPSSAGQFVAVCEECYDSLRSRRRTWV